MVKNILITLLLDVTSCSVIDVQATSVSKKRNRLVLRASVLKAEALISSETK
jgi:hypothetical protein